MHRRGPNGNGVWQQQTATGQHVVLLHSRLAILDLTNQARQPYHVGDQTLAFNGEIYNFRELRSELHSRQLESTGDTAVFAHLLHEKGISALDQCEGMWAFAWFDAGSGTLTLCRDRFGEKPLYVLRTSDEIYFGSEPKFIFALRGQKLPINRRQVRRFLVNGYKSLYKTRETFWDGLEEVPPGYFVVAKSREDYVETPYWTPQFRHQLTDMTFEEAVEGTRDRLIESMTLRLRSDVPLAFLLSGGVDSNVLVGIAKKELGFDVHGFTIVNTDARYEELDMVMTTVNELKVRHTPIPIPRGDFLNHLTELVRYHDAPVFTLTYYVQWRLMQEIAAQDFRVSISGTGADELFSGYYDHHLAYLAGLQRTDPHLYENARTNWETVVQKHVRNPYLSDPDFFTNSPMARQHIYLDAESFSKMLTRTFEEPFSESIFSPSLLRNRMANELTAESVPVILHEDDLNAMYFSIENRSPFLDRRLFEWTTTVPDKLLVKDGLAKALLREAGRGLVPDIVLDNPRKVGFNAPITDFLDYSDPKVQRKLLSESPIFELVKREEIERLLRVNDLPNSRSKFLFNFLSCRAFLEEFS